LAAESTSLKRRQKPKVFRYKHAAFSPTRNYNEHKGFGDKKEDYRELADLLLP
jgi:hypothetical protein